MTCDTRVYCYNDMDEFIGTCEVSGVKVCLKNLPQDTYYITLEYVLTDVNSPISMAVLVHQSTMLELSK